MAACKRPNERAPTRYTVLMPPRANLILANRAYLEHIARPGEAEPPPPANGGLLAALRPIIVPWAGRGGTTWIGAGRGPFDRDWADPNGYELLPTVGGELRHRRLFFDDATWQGHYAHVANSFLWPLLHIVREPLPVSVSYYPMPTLDSKADWDAYQRVNAAFAQAALEEEDVATCWVHDYQLALVPGLLRSCGFEGRIGYFLHTPFPDPEIVRPLLDAESLDRLRQFVAGILGAGLVGFQTDADADRFERAAVELCGAELHEDGLAVFGRVVRIDSYPVGIDAGEVLEVARSAPASAIMAKLVPPGLPVVAGLERADYTKGIPERLGAIAEAFRAGARFAYLGVAAPTRAGVPSYAGLEAAISGAVAEAEAAAHEAGMPFLQLREAIDWPGVIAIQRAAAVVFTSSLADGLNLVPLQAAVAQSLRPQSDRGVIISGRDAGVAQAFAGFAADGLVPVEPLDPKAMMTTLLEALSARPGRISGRLIDAVKTNDARAWATRFLTDLEDAC